MRVCIYNTLIIKLFSKSYRTIKPKISPPHITIQNPLKIQHFLTFSIIPQHVLLFLLICYELYHCIILIINLIIYKFRIKTRTTIFILIFHTPNYHLRLSKAARILENTAFPTHPHLSDHNIYTPLPNYP